MGRLEQLTIKEAHEGLKKKEFSSSELVKACLKRVEKINKEINSFITVSGKEALEQAEEIDKKIEEGKKINLLEGIPFSVKDAICTKGIRSTGGAKILDNYIPPYDATVISKIKSQGGIIIGKNNCDPFGHGASNENSDYGPVHNPYDLNKVSGGSSGGSAAAVATDMAVYSIAEDTGGSIRQPAAFCGVVGLKVSYGRNSRYGIMPMASSLDTVGAMGKTVWDVAAIQEIIAGHDNYDSSTVSDKVPSYTKLLDKKIKGLKIGLPKEYFIEGLDKETETAVKDAVKHLESLGAEVSEVSLPLTKYAIADYYIIVPAEDSANLARLDGLRYGVLKKGKNLVETYLLSRAQGFPDEVKRRIMIGTYALSSGYYDAYYLKAAKVRTLIRKEFDKAFEKVDVLVTPVSPFPAFDLGSKKDDPLEMYLADAFVCPASLAGLCALSLPCGKTKTGLPIGLQIIGPRLKEDRILNVGYMYEQSTDWHKMTPDI